MSGSSSWLLTSSEVGRANRARVLRLLSTAGPLTRPQLAHRLGVSRATVGAVIQPLLDSQVLVELDPLASGGSGGKPSRPLWYGQQRLLGAVYLSAEECEVALVHMGARIVARQRGRVPEGDPDVALAMVEALVKSVVGDVDLTGIGVAFAGMVDSPTGSLLANYRRPEVGQLPVGPILSSTFGVPVFVDHHPRVQAYGDAWFGLARSLDTAGSVFTGEVLGLGIIHDGQVREGVRGAGGEAGHMVVDMNGLMCLCGRRGCWETVATLTWLRAEAQRRGIPNPDRVTSASLVAASATRGAEPELARQYARNIALGLANLEQIMGLGTYILHGDVAGGGEVMRSWIAEDLVANSPHREPAPSVVLAGEPDESSLLGGAALVLAHLFPAAPPLRKPAARRGTEHKRRHSVESPEPRRV